MTIEEVKVTALIYRAILKLEAVYRDQKASQMVAFRTSARPRLRSLQSHEVMPGC